MNSIILYSAIAEKGYKLFEFSRKMQMSYKTFARKMKNPDEFTLGEIKKFGELLEVDWMKLLTLPDKIL